MRKLVVVGSDERDRYVGEIAQRLGWEVSVWAMRKDTFADVTPASFPEGASLLGPISGVDADGYINAERGLVRIDRTILQKMAGGFLAAGIIAPPIRRLAEDLRVRVISYRECETFAWQNAVLTAEGAIQAAIGRSGYGLYRRPVGVLGYGRVGRALSRRLKSLGADVRVFDREPAHRSEARSEGITAYPIEPTSIGTIDLLFNTIPYPVITREWECLLMDVPIFELASAPGGVAPEVDRANLSLSLLPGIPGKIAPKRAAEIIWETVMGD